MMGFAKNCSCLPIPVLTHVPKRDAGTRIDQQLTGIETARLYLLEIANPLTIAVESGKNLESIRLLPAIGSYNSEPDRKLYRPTCDTTDHIVRTWAGSIDPNRITAHRTTNGQRQGDQHCHYRVKAHRSEPLCGRRLHHLSESSYARGVTRWIGSLQNFVGRPTAHGVKIVLSISHFQAPSLCLRQIAT